MILSLIVAADENNVIGGSNRLLWNLPDDMKRFRELTKGHAVIMGRKTFESIGRALTNRKNLVITRDKTLKVSGVGIAGSLDEALHKIDREETEAFIIGGGEIYAQALPRAEKIYLTRVHSEFTGDTLFPEINEKDWIETGREEHSADEKHQFGFTFIDYKRR